MNYACIRMRTFPASVHGEGLRGTQEQLAPWSPFLTVTCHSKELGLLGEMVDSRAEAKTEHGEPETSSCARK